MRDHGAAAGETVLNVLTSPNDEGTNQTELVEALARIDRLESFRQRLARDGTRGGKVSTSPADSRTLAGATAIGSTRDVLQHAVCLRARQIAGCELHGST